MQDVGSARSNQGLVVALGAVLAALVAGLILLMLGTRSFETWGGVLLTPILVALSVPALRRQAEREADARLLSILLAALVLKLGASIVRHYVAFTVYEGVADAAGYDGWGSRIAENFWNGNFSTGLDSLSGTNFVRFFTGGVYSVVGPSRLGGFLFFSWIGFWGLFLFYRAFTIAVPEGRHRSYAYLIFFLPSLLYWPSSIGKEAWMMFALGVTAFGAAKVLSGRTWRGLPMTAAGLWMAALVRPHVAGMMAVALVAGLAFRKPRTELRHLAPIVKAATLVAVVVVAAILVIRTDRFLKASPLGRGATDVTSVLTDVQERTQVGRVELRALDPGVPSPCSRRRRHGRVPAVASGRAQRAGPVLGFRRHLPADLVRRSLPLGPRRDREHPPAAIRRVRLGVCGGLHHRVLGCGELRAARARARAAHAAPARLGVDPASRAEDRAMHPLASDTRDPVSFGFRRSDLPPSGRRGSRGRRSRRRLWGSGS